MWGVLLASSLAGCAFRVGPSEVPPDGANDGETGVDAAPDASTCPADFIVVAGAPATSRYKIYGWSATANHVATWDVAVATCASQQTHLAIVDNVAERDALAAVIPRNLAAGITQDLYWDGITDAAIELQWMTVLGTVPPYAVWGPNEGPNKGGPDPVQNCAAVYVPGQCINDAACSVTYFFPFACECEL